MIKRILAGAATAAFAATLLTAGSASAACPTGSQTPVSGSNKLAQAPAPVGSTVYGSGGAGGGYLGVTGNTGYIEAGGAPNTSGGYVRGSANGQPVNGEIIVSGNPQVCVAGTTVK